jgi:hypothetical protein
MTRENVIVNFNAFSPIGFTDEVTIKEVAVVRRSLFFDTMLDFRAFSCTNAIPSVNFISMYITTAERRK